MGSRREPSVNALRADQVGSLLRPPALLQARIDRAAGRLDLEGLRAEEDLAIRDVLRRQRDCGIDVCTDGELRRGTSMTGLLDAAEGLEQKEAPALPWRGGGGMPTQRAAV